MPAAMMTSTMLNPPTVDFPKSKIRRKPITTYKSPSANDTDPLIASSTRNGAPNTPAQPLSDRSNPPQSAQNHLRTDQRRYMLPLYHPLGKLALSLPPLNPADFGLPLPRLPDETNQRSTADSRSSTKPFDVDEDVPVPSVSSIAAVAANEVKRVSPRKRRAGAGSGKRRRRDIEDGDATYPAKRIRQARVGGDEIGFDEVHVGDADGTLELDDPIERRPERRSTRSRTKRRDSDEIESPDDEHPVQDSSLIPDENIRQTIPEEVSESTKEEKEEGEISGDR